MQHIGVPKACESKLCIGNLTCENCALTSLMDKNITVCKLCSFREKGEMGHLSGTTKSPRANLRDTAKSSFSAQTDGVLNQANDRDTTADTYYVPRRDG